MDRDKFITKLEKQEFKKDRWHTTKKIVWYKKGNCIVKIIGNTVKKSIFKKSPEK